MTPGGVDEANYSLRYTYRWAALEWEPPIGRIARIDSSAEVVTYHDLVVLRTVDEGSRPGR